MRIGGSQSDKTHAAECRRILKEIDKLPDRKLQAQVFYEIRRLNAIPEWKVQKFAVLKQPWKNLKRGDKVFGEDIKQMDKNGIKYRNIRCFDKTHNRELKRISKLLDISAPWQHGFTTSEGIQNVAREIIQNSAKATISLDLDNAFDHISQRQVYYIIRMIFRINKKDATQFAKNMCLNGFIFQGNPIAPLIFNIWSINIGYRMKRAGFIVSQYADDIFVISKYEYVSYKIIRLLCNIICDSGWQVNKQKVKVQHKLVKCLGLVIDNLIARPDKRKRLKKKIRYFDKLKTKYGTRRLSETKDSDMVLNGLKGWLGFAEKQINMIIDTEKGLVNQVPFC